MYPNEVFNVEPPRGLYHYTDVRGVHGMMRDRAAWATAVQYLNDSSEFRHAIDLARGECDRQKVMPENTRRANLIEYVRGELHRLEGLWVCVFSLSEERDLLSQWRAYCPDGNGVAIGFDGPGLRHLALSQGFTLAPCIYEENEQRRVIRSALEPVLRLLPEGIPDSEVKRVGEQQIGGVFGAISPVGALLKHSGFAEEREWRVVWHPTRGTDIKFEYRVGRRMMMPYVSFPLQTNDVPMPLLEFVMGPTRDLDLAWRSLTGYLGSIDVPWKSSTRSFTPFRPL